MPIVSLKAETDSGLKSNTALADSFGQAQWSKNKIKRDIPKDSETSGNILLYKNMTASASESFPKCPGTHCTDCLCRV